MRSQKRLRDELRFITEFNTLCDVIQQSAVSQLSRANARATQQPLLMEILRREFLPLVPASAAAHPLVRAGVRGHLLVVFTSDEGLVGPLHAEVVRQAQQRAGRQTQWIMVGQRGMRLLGTQAVTSRVMPIPSEDEEPDRLRKLSAVILAQFTREALQDAWLVAPQFISTTRQEVTAQQLLPLPVPPSQGRHSDEALIIEPSVERIVHELATLWVEYACVETFWSARRAEFAARALHMERSRQELATHSKRLQYEFFKALHERVDVMVRETCVMQRLSAAKHRAGHTMVSAAQPTRQPAYAKGP